MREVCHLLEARGLSTFLDRNDLVAGLPWPEKLEEGLSRAAAVAVFLGPSGLGDWQRREMYFALDRQVAAQRQERGFPVIPVLLPGAEPRTGFLFLNTWVDLRDDPQSPEGIDALERAVWGGEERDRAASLTVCPYRGLRPFEEEHAPFFCGREDLSARLRDAVLTHPFVAVVGPSGSGKSSAVRAGLLPLLFRQRPPAATWDAATFRPRQRPFYELASALLRRSEPGLPFDELDRRATSLGQRILSGETRLEDAVNRYLDDAGGTDRLLLVADQLEELFTLSVEEQRRPLVDTLLGAVGGRLAVVTTLRADFYGRALNLSRALSDALERSGQVNLGPMTAGELQRAVEEPAHRVGMSFQDGLVARILGDLGTEPGRLPLLQFALTELFQAARGGTMTHTAYDAFGGVEGAISQRAEEELSRLDPTERAAAKRLFVTHLIRVALPDEGAEDARRPARLDDLDETARRVAHQLAREESRLLVVRRDATRGEVKVEVAHEALIRQWKRLRAWVDEDREFLLWRRRLEVRLAEWRDTGEDPRTLLTGPPLAEARRWLSDRPQDLTAAQLNFIEAGVARRRRQQRRRSALFAATVAAAVVFLLLAGLALRAWRAARAGELRAWTNSVLAYASNVAESDPHTAALLAAELAERPGVEEVPGGVAQLHAIAELPIPRLVLPGLSRRQLPIARILLRGERGMFSPGGDRIVTGSWDGTARVWNVERPGTPVVLRAEQSEVLGTAFGPAGDRVVTTSTEAVRVWRADGSGEPVTLAAWGSGPLDSVFTPDGDRVVTVLHAGIVVFAADGSRQPLVCSGFEEDAISSAALSPSGALVATGTYDGAVRLLSTADCTEPVVFGGHDGAVRDIAFSDDGAHFATASADRTIRVCRTDGAGAPTTLVGHGDAVESVDFSPRGDRVVSASTDATVRLWPADGGTAPVVFDDHDGSVHSARFGPDGRRIVTASLDGTARVWYPDDPVGTRVLRMHGEILLGADLNSVGNRIVTVSNNGTVRVWNGDESLLEPRILVADGNSELWSLGFSRDGSRLSAIARSLVETGFGTSRLAPGRAWVWNGDGSGEPAVFEPCTSSALSPDGSLIVCTDGTKVARMWRTDGSGDPIVLHGHEDEVKSAIFDPDGGRIVTASDDATARIWKVDAPVVPLVLSRHGAAVNTARFGPGGDRVVTASADGAASVWHLDGTRDPPVVAVLPHEHEVERAVFTSDGRRVVTETNRAVLVWRADGPGEPAVFEESGYRRHVAVAPGGDRIAIAGSDGTVRLFDAGGTGEPLVLAGRDDTVTDVVFGPSGELLVTASEDGTVLVWRTDGSGEPLVLEGHGGGVRGVAFRPADGRLATASEDGTVRLWRVRWQSLLRYFRDSTAACLDPTERRRYLSEAPDEARERHRACEETLDRPAG